MSENASSVFLGLLEDGAGSVAVYFDGEGHLMTVAPTGSGKGQGHILPNLLTYPGSVFVLDIKDGENYRYTAKRRDFYGKVLKFSPFSQETDCYNPLVWVGFPKKENAWSEAEQLADLVLVPEKDFFDDRARGWLAAIIYYICTAPFFEDDERNMAEVCHFVWGSGSITKDMCAGMRKTDDVLLIQTADDIETTQASEREYSATINTIKRSLNIWRNPQISKATSSMHEDWMPADLRISAAMQEMAGDKPGYRVLDNGLIERGMARSIYIVLPATQTKVCTSLLRVLLGQHIVELMKVPSIMPDAFGIGCKSERLPSAPVMFIADEFPQLGYMKPVEEILTMGRSYRLRLWLFAQDVGQLAMSYRNWRGILANCNVQSFMNINDNETARYVSERLGKRKSAFGSSSEPLASVADLLGEKFDENFVCMMRNKKPMKLRKFFAYKDEAMRQAMGME